MQFFQEKRHLLKKIAQVEKKLVRFNFFLLHAIFFKTCRREMTVVAPRLQEIACNNCIVYRPLNRWALLYSLMVGWGAILSIKKWTMFRVFHFMYKTRFERWFRSKSIFGPYPGTFPFKKSVENNRKLKFSFP